MKIRMAKIHLHVTNVCTSFCKHCSSEAGPHGKRYLTRKDFEKIVDWANIGGATWLEISGGEPLTLGEDLFHVIKYAHNSGLYVSLLSNGCLIDERKAKKLRRAGAERIGISIYGANANTHDDFTRTPGSFSKMMNGMNNVSNVGIETIANVIVTPKNLNELYRLPSLLKGIDLYTFGSIVPAGRGLTSKAYTFPEKGYTQSIEKIDHDFTGVDHYFMISMYPHASNELDRYCMRPVEEVVLSHMGHMIPCCVLPNDLRKHKEDVPGNNFNKIIFKDPVFHWLEHGHKAMRQYLKYSRISRNLCKNCIEMLHLLNKIERELA